MTAESRRVVRYDGQTILLDGEGGYELGAYLGGGASGVVYEANYVGSKQRVAVKILHPLGFKAVRGGFDRYTELTEPREDVRWFVHPQTKDVVVTSKDGKELSLLKCIEIFGMQLPKEDLTDAQVLESIRQGRRKGLFPPKYAKFLRQRALIFREISSMRRVSGHRNVLRLDDVLELIQESKLTFFLVLELASGGELFDRITADEGCDEEVACNYMRQLLEGVLYCHSKGVCHRDLKPENLLLTHDGNTLKIADFGLSTNMVHDPIGASSGAAMATNTLKLNGSDPLRRLVSVVGSCHYIAPEVLNKQAYDGTKADAWSIGVILYALLNGSLPFGKDLLICPRFLTFSKTLKETSSNDGRRFFCGDFESVNKLRSNLDWFIPEKLSTESVVLIIGLLNPDPVERYTVKRALADVWFKRGRNDHLEDSVAPQNIMLDADEDDLDERILLAGDDDSMEVEDDGIEENDMFEIDVPKPTSFIPTPSKQIKASPSGHGHQGANRHLAAVTKDVEMDVARSAPVARHFGVGGGPVATATTGAMAFSFTSPPLAPRQSLSPPVVIGSGSGATTPFNDNDASSEEGGTSYRKDSGLSSSVTTRKSIVRRTSASFKPAGGFRSRSSSPTRRMTGAVTSSDFEAPIFHAAMKRSTVFATCVPANQVLERLSKTVAELGGLSSRIDWERFQIEITQDESSLQLCVVQVFLSRERPGPVYIVEFVRGPEFEIFAFKAFYTEVMQHLASIVRADHMHTMRC